jgi:thiol-disulfide isomerase/thioredoxin/outer membrane lipoprotein-sorting protein
MKLALLAAIALCAASAQENAPLEILRKVADTYKNAHSYELHGTDTLEQNIRGSQRTTERRFRAYRLQPSFMRVDFADGGRRLTEGHFEWNYNPQTKQYARKAVPWDSRGRRAFNEFFYDYEGIADSVKSAGFITPPGKDGYLIEVTYKLAGELEENRTYWIDAERYLVRRQISHPAPIVEPPTTGPIKLTRTITFQDAVLNAPLEAAFFAPPHEERAPSGPAPEFTLPDLDGSEVALGGLRGHPVLLYFWATWCGLCRGQMPRIERLAREYGESGLLVLGINDEEPAVASAYLRENHRTLRSLADRWKDVGKKYGIETVPTVILIGKDGRILYSDGSSDDAALRRALQKAGLN